ncbi:MAG: hypothetical protein JXK05_04665 [Campylobacterales bacterium]|nr:hypothetical protein [Campylobacterales bacterium]
MSALMAASFSVELGAYMPHFDGTIENPSTITTYDKDLLYDAAEPISYFGAEVNFESWYLPTLRLGYFNMSDSKNAVLTQTKEFVSWDYNGSVTTWTDYTVINAVIAKDFYRKGSYIDLFGVPLYTGDLIFDLGLNLKKIAYRFDVRQNGPVLEKDFITVDSEVLMPYFGISYRVGRFNLGGDISGLAFGEVKANSYKLALEYRVYGGIALRGGYMYESFEATEKKDEVTFKASGAFGSVRYYF